MLFFSLFLKHSDNGVKWPFDVLQKIKVHPKMASKGNYFMVYLENKFIPAELKPLHDIVQM